MSEHQKITEYLQGRSLQGHRLFGAHIEERNGQKGVRFTVFAPAARRVELIGDFNSWNGTAMCRDDMGVWDLFVPGAAQGQLYKYRIVTQTGEVHDRAGPLRFIRSFAPIQPPLCRR